MEVIERFISIEVYQITMEMTTIKVSKDMANRLNKWKYELGVKSIEDVIDRVLKVVPASELKNLDSKKGWWKRK